MDHLRKVEIANTKAEHHKLQWNKNMESFAKLNAVLVI